MTTTNETKPPQAPPAEKFRLRLQYVRGDEIKYISHLDLMRLWLRAIRRADLPLAYSEGFSPHPQISAALPLPVGVAGDAELLDIALKLPMEPEAFLDALRPQLPPAIQATEAWYVPVGLKSLPPIVIAADYSVEVETDEQIESVQQRIDDLLALETLPWERTRQGKVKSYDLRPLIETMSVETSEEGSLRIRMRLVASNTRAGRADDVMKALGFGESFVGLRRHQLYFSAPIR